MSIFNKKEWEASNCKRERESSYEDKIQEEVKRGVRRKGWAVKGFGFLDFHEPVTYEQAEHTAKIFKDIHKTHKDKESQNEST